MQYITRLLLIVLFSHFGMLSAEVTKTDTALAKLNKYLLNLDSYEANFQQQVVNNSRRIMEKSSGKFVMQRPNRFRWEIIYPYEQIIIADGKYLWSIDKDLEQVTVADLDHSLINSPITLLSQKNTQLNEFFKITLRDSEDAEDSEMEKFLLLPNDNNSNFESIQLGFKEGILQSIELFDSLGQITIVTLTNIRNNPLVSNLSFVYTVIPEFDFIDSRSQEAKGD